MAIIIAKVKGKEVFRHSLPKTKPTVIGRGEETDIKLEIHGISRRHTHIEFSNGQWIVRDLGSTNGTLVNGKKISSQALNRNDNIQLGDVTLKVIIEDQGTTPTSTLKSVAGKPIPSFSDHKKKRASRKLRRSAASKAVKWIMRLAVWLVLVYCAWGYYQYMTIMKEAIRYSNNGVDLHDEGRYDEAITALETARTLEEESRENLFVKFAHPYLPQRELSVEENVAKCYYARGNSLYNNMEENLDREALEDFERAFRIKPDMPGLAKTMFPIAFSQSNWQLTLDATNEALRQDPNNTMIEKIRDIARTELSGE